MLKQMFFYLILTLILFIATANAAAEPVDNEQEPDDIISIDTYPGLTIPVPDDAELYKTGFLNRLHADYRLKYFPYISFFAGGEYDLIPIKALISLSTYVGYGGLGINLNLTERLLLKLDSMIGYSHSVINSGISKGESSGGFYYSGGGDLSWRINQEWSAGLGFSYVNHNSLYQGYRFTAKGSYFINLDSTHAVQVKDSSSIEIFPSLINYHNTIPVITAEIQNVEQYDASDIKYELKLKKYMDDTVYSDGPSVIKYNEKATALYYPEFNLLLKTASEGKDFITAPLNALVRYNYNDWFYKEKIKYDLIIYNQNSIRWDDPYKVSVFITPEDSDIISLTQNTINSIKDKSRIPVPDEILKALALYKTIDIGEIKYFSDEKTPYQLHIKKPYPVDQINYPAESAADRKGDSSELSILFCSLMQATDMKTALATTPDACFAAFALDEENVISHSDILIEHDGIKWMPVDLRNPDQSFDKAVESALGIWNSMDSDQKGIYTFRKGREKYLTPSPPDKKGNVKIPDSKEIVEAYLEDIKSYAYWEIRPDEELYREIIGLSEEYPELTNKLGVLYARFEKYNEAYSEFEKSAGKEYAPAIVNLANLYFLDDRLEEALPLYEKAYRKNAYNAPMLQNMAVAYYKRLDFGLTREIYRKLEFIDYELAEEVPFMGERSREMKKASSDGHEIGINNMNIFTENFLIEKGNQYYILNRLKQSQAFYEKAEQNSPDDPEVLLSLARVNYEQDNYYTATQYYNRLKIISPDTAEKNSYLISQNTGAIMNKALENLKGDVRWVEE